MFAKNGKIREDGRMVHDMYLFEVKKPSESKGRWDDYKLLATDPRQRGVPVAGSLALPAGEEITAPSLRGEAKQSMSAERSGLLRRFAPSRNDGANQPTTKKAPPMSANEMVLQKLDAGLLTITMNRPDRRNALNPDMTRGLVEAARRAADDHEVRAVLLKGAGGTFCVGGDVKSMAEGRAPLAVRGQDGQSAPRHGSVAHPAPDAEARGGAARRRRRRRRALDRAVLRPARRQRLLQDHDRVRQGRIVGRLRRHLFPDPDARQRQGARTVSDLAGAERDRRPTISAW